MRTLSALAECLRITGVVICLVLFGGFALLFLDAISGAIGATGLVATIFAPIILANYLLWGRRYTRRLRQQEAVRDE